MLNAECRMPKDRRIEGPKDRRTKDEGRSEATMATVTVLKCPTAEGAAHMLGRIRELHQQHLITLTDAAIVSWPAGAKAPKTKQLVNLVATGASTGMFWGALFGLIFCTPFFGMALGAAGGALGGAFRDYGIDDHFITRLRSEVTEGTSALFLMTTGAVIDRVSAALRGERFEIIATNLSAEEEAQLRAAFA
jgi:uncharacterized membrane protein